MKDRLEKWIATATNEATELQRAADRSSNWRLFSILLGIGGGGWLWWSGLHEIGWLAACSAGLTFILLVRMHRRQLLAWRRIQCGITLQQRLAARLNNAWMAFPDDGTEFMAAKHPYSNDLDLFGPKSLFQWLNATSTYYGRQRLKDRLAYPEKNAQLIRARQNAIRELSGKETFCHEFSCDGLLFAGAHDPEEWLQSIDGKPSLWGCYARTFFYFLPFITLVCAMLAVFEQKSAATLLSLCVLAQCAVTLFTAKKNSSLLLTVHRFRAAIKGYEKMIRRIEAEPFAADELLRLQSLFRRSEGTASGAIQKLDRILEAADLRYNSISYVLLNFTLLWDCHCTLALQRWNLQHGEAVRAWLEGIGELEVLISQANIARIQPRWTFPQIREDGPAIEGEALGHPLINSVQRICNDVSLSQGVCVITGSNMSGKTTWLRTIGVNLVLAYAGSPVCATRFACSMIDLWTSMRLQDELGSGISTFYAELLRIKDIIEHAKKKRDMIFLIDEIFRGTNSHDRIQGAVSVLKSLQKSWLIGLISTHDLELCQLEREEGIQAVNYHFREEYRDGEILFDYKMREGSCNSSNAKQLMKMVGIEISA
ncbi:MutS-related protein [Azotosporobacter soli]|uniref:MutS-related protein n=1 Tax=Azotosporobacter soli TaxID=3055040 RepID=UPI0031FE54B4